MTHKLVLVADATRAHFITGKGRKLHHIIQELINDNFNTLEPDPRKEGRNTGGHFFDPTTEVKDIEKQIFANTISTELERHMLDGKYDSLILVAIPKMLGLIRKKINSRWHVERALPLEATLLTLPELEDKVFP